MNIRKLLCTFGFFTATILGASSAPIDFTSGTNISGDSDVNTLGTLVAAFNMGATGVTSARR